MMKQIIGFLGIVLSLASHAHAQVIPLPPFSIYGEVGSWNGRAYAEKDEATVIIKINGEVMDRCDIVSGIYPGLNYRAQIPMSNTPMAGRGETGDPISFEVYYDGQLHAVQTIDTPPVVGHPAGAIRCDLFLGTDADADGLPDEYENLLLPYYTAAGKGSNIWQISPDDDFDGDGFTNLQEFYAGTIPVMAIDFFRIEEFYPISDNQFALSFLTAPGRTYTLPETQNLASNQWSSALYSTTTNTAPASRFYSSPTDEYITLYLFQTNNTAAIRLEVE